MDYKITQVNPYFNDDEIKEISQTLRSGWVTEGPKSRQFVSEILKITKAKYGVLAPNGTLALYIALKVLGIKEGDEVILPDFTMNASAEAVYLTGAKPVFVDVRLNDLNINSGLIEKYITSRTRILMPVHLYGQVADMEKILKIAKKHRLFIVEDACQALGVYYQGKHAGTFGDLGCFSFFADKTITTGGEGGMIITNNKKLYEKLLLFRNHGRPHSGTFIHKHEGYNFRMTDLQCAVGLAQLKKFNQLKNIKLKNDSLYKQYLKNVKQIRFLGAASSSTFIPFRTNVYVEKLPELMKSLEQKGIQTRGMFYPLHRQPCFGKYKYDNREFPNANYAYEHGFSLPVHGYLTRENIKYVCQIIKEFYDSQ